jgi:hypothetical protein
MKNFHFTGQWMSMGLPLIDYMIIPNIFVTVILQSSTNRGFEHCSHEPPMVSVPGTVGALVAAGVHPGSAGKKRQQQMGHFTNGLMEIMVNREITFKIHS